MNPADLSRHYSSLSPEERFKLILAAIARGDDAELQRLHNAGRRITVSQYDHAPYLRAFLDLATMCYFKVIDDAARYLEALHGAGDPGRCEDAAQDETGGSTPRESEQTQAAPAAPVGAHPAAGRSPRDAGRAIRSAGRAHWRRVLAAGYVLRTNVAGWQRFCEQLPVPPWWMWSTLPGFDRLQRALAQAEKVAFTSEEYQRWVNEECPEWAASETNPLTVEAVAAEVAQKFQEMTRRNALPTGADR
jgi:hypothetical protein